jgi:hypothetical protein
VCINCLARKVTSPSHSLSSRCLAFDISSEKTYAPSKWDIKYLINWLFIFMSLAQRNDVMLFFIRAHTHLSHTQIAQIKITSSDRMKNFQGVLERKMLPPWVLPHITQEEYYYIPIFCVYIFPLLHKKEKRNENPSENKFPLHHTTRR